MGSVNYVSGFISVPKTLGLNPDSATPTLYHQEIEKYNFKVLNNLLDSVRNLFNHNLHKNVQGDFIGHYKKMAISFTATYDDIFTETGALKKLIEDFESVLKQLFFEDAYLHIYAESVVDKKEKYPLVFTWTNLEKHFFNPLDYNSKWQREIHGLEKFENYMDSLGEFRS